MKKLLTHTFRAGLLAACALASGAYAQTPLPNPNQIATRTTPAPGSEAALRKLIDSVARGAPDYAAMTPIFAGAIRNDVRRSKELFAGFGALQSLVFKEVSPQGADVYAANFDTRTIEFRIMLDATGKMGVTFTPPPAAPIERLDDTALADFIRDEMDAMDYSGAVLVARDGKPIFAAARGLADREQNIPNTLDTRFRVGSMNKIMTAVGIMQLVQAKKVRLDATLGEYLEDYPNKELARTVTVHQLLTHTGGTGDFFGPMYEPNRLSFRTLKDYVTVFGGRPTEFTPGDNYRYSNYGFILLGRIIEEVSGQTYPDYIRDHVFKAAGMTRSGFEPEAIEVEGRAVGYIWESPAYRSAAKTLPPNGTSAGGGYATVGDFLAFANALTGHKLLDAKHTDLMTTRKTSTGDGYGLEDLSTAEIRMVARGGGAGGMNGRMRIIGDGKVVIVALTNENPPPFANAIENKILSRIRVLTDSGRLATFRRASPAPDATLEQRIAAFDANDRNNDGKLDKAEVRGVLGTLGLYADQLNPILALYDVNKDGFVSDEENRNPPPR